MTVKRDRKGKWRYRKVVHLPDGRTTRINGTPDENTRKAAEAAERAHIQRVLQPVQRREAMTFRTFIEEQWWPVYPKSAGNRPSTVREKEQHLRLHLLPHLGTYKLDQLKGRVLDTWLSRLVDEGLSEKTRKNVRATLRKALVSAVEWELIEAVPMLPKIKVPEPGFDHFTREESQLLLAAARDDRERLLLLFALRTGARLGEQLALQWGDIDWQSKTVTFQRSRTGGTEGPTKSGRVRHVPLGDELLGALRAARHLKGERVFCLADGGPLSPSPTRTALEMACRGAGLRRIRWHDLRHSFASQLISSGVSLRQVQEWLGHSTIIMTMRYAHLAPAGGRELIAALDGGGRAGLSLVGGG